MVAVVPAIDPASNLGNGGRTLKQQMCINVEFFMLQTTLRKSWKTWTLIKSLKLIHFSRLQVYIFPPWTPLTGLVFVDLKIFPTSISTHSPAARLEPGFCSSMTLLVFSFARYCLSHYYRSGFPRYLETMENMEFIFSFSRFGKVMETEQKWTLTWKLKQLSWKILLDDV